MLGVLLPCGGPWFSMGFTLRGVCSRKWAPGTRCLLVRLRSKEKADDTKRQDVSSASSISPPARQRAERWRAKPREGEARARGQKLGKGTKNWLCTASSAHVCTAYQMVNQEESDWKQIKGDPGQSPGSLVEEWEKALSNSEESNILPEYV